MDFTRKDGSTETIYRWDIEGWQKTYPNLDVAAELRKARDWLDENPRRRKTHIKRYLQNWLNRASEVAPKRNGMHAYIDKQDAEFERRWRNNQGKRANPKHAAEQMRKIRGMLGE